MAEHAWELPQLLDSEFRFRVGTSMLEEFARSHTPADVLRELVQNEYDAGGAAIEVDFGSDALVVRGTGAPIDKQGWQRLSVVLGTGLVGGSAERIAAKVNGVGSKNFGLRSLFLFGDRIFVSSAGRMTVLDLTSGVLDRRLADLETAGQPGVVLRIPYRETDDGPLPRFGLERERDAFHGFAEELAPTVVKLTLPDTRRGLRTVVVRSARLDGELVWQQSTRRTEDRPGRLERAVRIRHQGFDHDGVEGVTTAIREVEYSRNVVVPDRYRQRDLPSYFRVRGARIRLALSFRVVRGTIDLDSAGLFYYPLGASRSRTGFPFSLAAPFEMNEDRSQLVDLGTSDWNAWLVNECAQLATDLLGGDVFADFGARGYLAFDTHQARMSTVPELVEAVESRLRSQACWPSRATVGRNRRPVFRPATTLTTPSTPALAEVVNSCLPAAEVCHPTLTADPRVRELAARHGTVSFTPGSLVRLWCAGADAHELATKPGPGEANRHYDDYPAEMRDLALQRRLAAALDAVRAELTDKHRGDLRRSAHVLSAAATLAPVGQLWHVDPALADAIPAAQQLHPQLSDYDIVRSLCRPFNASRWVIETCERMRDGRASDSERDALARLLRDGPPLSAKAWAAARRAPVLRDQRGQWTAPADLVSRRTPNAQLLASAIRNPKAEEERNPRLARLRLRAALEPSDLVALARLVADGAEPSVAIITAITRLPKLLTPATIARLRDIAFLPTTTGALAPPSRVHERTDRLVAALGEDAPFAVDTPSKILKQLKCPTLPPVDVVVAAVRRRWEQNEPLPRPDLVYRVLIESARAERRRADEYRDEPILWTGAAWEAPAECLTGSDNAALFRDAVTVLPEQAGEMYRALGVPAKPEPTHWRRLLEWAGDRYGSDRPVPPQVARRLTRVYLRLDTLPDGLAPSTPCLLDEKATLHSPAQAALGRLLVNDEPALATAARSAGAPLAFVHPSEPATYRFLRAAGVRSLTQLAQYERVSWGAEVEAGPALRVASALARLQHPNFASALRALVSTLRGPDVAGPPAQLSAALVAIDQITLVDGIARHYRVHGTTVEVPAEYAVEPDRILLSDARTPHEFWEVLSAAVAAIADPSDAGEQALRDPIYFLLRCTTAEQIRRELARRKVAWLPDLTAWPDPAEPDDDLIVDLDPASLLADVIGRAAAESLTATPAIAGVPAAVPPVPTTRAPRGQLPDIDEVHAKLATELPRPDVDARNSGYSGVPSSWTPRDDQDREDDRLLGRRGEQLVLRHLQERLRQQGRSPDLAAWIADLDPFADHDITTLDAGGERVWVEVKATTGRDGRFRWSKAEFQLALRARDRYLLFRVYEAHTLNPRLLEVRDPVGRFQAGGLDLGLDSLAVDVGPAN